MLLRREHAAHFSEAAPQEAIAGDVAQSKRTEREHIKTARWLTLMQWRLLVAAQPKTAPARTLRLLGVLKWSVAAACLALATGWWMQLPYLGVDDRRAGDVCVVVEAQVEVRRAADAPENVAKGWLSAQCGGDCPRR